MPRSFAAVVCKASPAGATLLAEPNLLMQVLEAETKGRLNESAQNHVYLQARSFFADPTFKQDGAQIGANPNLTPGDSIQQSYCQEAAAFANFPASLSFGGREAWHTLQDVLCKLPEEIQELSIASCSTSTYRRIWQPSSKLGSCCPRPLARSPALTNAIR